MNSKKQKIRINFKKKMNNQRKILIFLRSFMIQIKLYIYISKKFKKETNIGIYFSNPKEVNTMFLIKWLLAKKHYNLYIPFLEENNSMNFCKIKSCKFKKKFNKGFFQPIDKSEIIEKNNIDIIIVPMVGCNTNLYRIGYGFAFYDKYLLNYKNIKIGICFDMSVTNENFEEKHDIKMNMIVTEKKWLKI